MGLLDKFFKPTVINPANGQVMPGGRSGYDMSGNLYGQNKSPHSLPKPPVFKPPAMKPMWPKK